MSEPDSIWESLRSRYLGLTTLSGAFRETATPAGGVPQEFRGSFAVELPGRYRLEVSEPQRQLMVQDGSVLWFYFPEEGRAVRQTGTQSVPLLAFIEPMLDSTTTAAIVSDSGQAPKLKVHPADSLASFSNLVLELDRNAGSIVAFSFVDAWGNDYHFALSEQQWNSPLPPRTFSFTPPPGTVVE